MPTRRNPRAHRPRNTSSLLIGAAIVLVVICTILLVVSGLLPGFEHLFAGSTPYCNAQAAALRQGSFAISGNPADVGFDLAWSGEGVQQVWGLGVGAWILFLSTLCGQQNPMFFPSRVAFAVAFVLVSVGLLLRIGDRARKTITHAHVRQYFVLLLPNAAVILLFPSFVALLKSQFHVYEEVCAYSYLCAIGLWLLLLRLCARPSLARAAVLFACAGVSAFVRPTLAFYGAGAVMAAIMVWLQVKKPKLSLICPFVLYTVPIFLLLWTNTVRFGSPLEFGHSLNLNYHPVSLYSTRFEFPYQEERTSSALREVLGALLFPGHYNYGAWLSKHVFHWQTATNRWRENYLPEIGWVMVSLAAAGILLSFRSRSNFESQVHLEMKASAVFAVLSSLCLALFYAWVPSLSSRYLYDFGAAIAVASSLTIWIVSIVTVRFSYPFWTLALMGTTGLLLFLGYRAGTMTSSSGRPVSLDVTEYKSAFMPMAAAVKSKAIDCREEMGVEQRAGRLHGLSGFFLDGFGWQPEDGRVGIVTVHYMYDVQFVELILSHAGGLSTVPNPRHIRVKVGSEELRLASCATNGALINLKFYGPERVRRRSGLQVGFIAWVTKDQISERLSPWILHRISWNTDTVRAHVGMNAAESEELRIRPGFDFSGSSDVKRAGDSHSGQSPYVVK